MLVTFLEVKTALTGSGDRNTFRILVLCSRRGRSCRGKEQILQPFMLLSKRTQHFNERKLQNTSRDSNPKLMMLSLREQTKVTSVLRMKQELC